MKNSVRRRIEALKTGWYIWLFPVVAVAISGWLLYDYFKQQGPRIHITFEDAASIVPEKTAVKFRGVAIGLVKDIYISEDQKSVTAEIILRKDASDFAVEGSKFSLITPKVNFQGVSGLDALFEGAYIAVLPGDAGGSPKFDFKALTTASVSPLDDTSAYLLEMISAESIGSGDAVTYRGVKVGSVTKIYFPKGGQKVVVQINIENKYTWLIRANTVFWRKIGVQAKLGLFGSEIKVNSMDSIMNGGVEFATPKQAGPMAKALEKFKLAAVAPKDVEKWDPVLD